MGTSGRIGWFLQAAQAIKTDWGFVRYVEPVARWDMMGLANSADFMDANRLTVGLNFGFNETVRRTELRLQYEHYFVNENMAPTLFGSSSWGPNEFIWHNKITLELLVNIN
jgi:hypothetical protein